LQASACVWYVAAIDRSEDTSPVFHVEANYEKAGVADGRPTLLELIRGKFGHLSASRALRRVPESKRTVILSLARDPVATYCSFVFQNPQIHRPHLMDPNGRLNPKRVRKFLNERFGGFDPDDDYIANWFDREFIATTGVNIYHHPFDYSAGCSIIRQPPYDVALLTLENLDRTLGTALQVLFGRCLELAPDKANRRSASGDARLYREVLADLVLPEECLRRIYSTKFATHFYSPEQIDRMVEKWSRRRSSAEPPA